MKILMYRWKAYNQHDIIQNLEHRGHTVDEITGELTSFEEDPYFQREFCKLLDSEVYDLVFTVNYFPLISDLCQSRDLLYVSWCCDSPLATLYHESVHHPVNRIFTFDKYNQLSMADLGVKLYYLPLCGAVDRMEEYFSEKNSPDTKAADIAFIGSMYNKNSYDEIYERLSDYRKGYFDAAVKLQTGVYSEYLLDDVLDAATQFELGKDFVIARSNRSFSDLPLIFSTTVLGFKIAQMERRSLIPELSRYGSMDVYTDDPEVDFVRARNCGPADYWKEAPGIFRSSRINLNLTIRNIRSGIPLRVWDIMSAGGFCMTNFQAELPFYFENGVDLVWFESREELFEKTAYYLAHEEERARIAKAGMEKIKQLHGYQNRFDEMSAIVPGL